MNRATIRLLSAVGVALATTASGAIAQTEQAMHSDFAEQVREWTTRPEFLSPLVDHLPASATVPSPREVLGHHAGAPRELTYYDDLIAYYRALADASPRVGLDLAREPADPAADQAK